MKKPVKIAGVIAGGILALGAVGAVAGVAGSHSQPAPKVITRTVTRTVVHTVRVPVTRTVTRTVTHTVRVPTSVPAPAPAPEPSQLSDKGWSVVPDSLITRADFEGDWGGTVRIMNENADSLSASFTLTLMRDGQQIGTMTGSVDQVAPGQTVTVDLISSDTASTGPFTYYFQTDYSF